jgi:eukaryotic-like serine/threonine-protein kinase
MADRAGQQLGHYRLIRQLGRGGFADVYLGEHLYLNTTVAIKVLQTHLAENDLPDFIKEARTIAGLSHQHIIRVLDFGLEDEVPYLVMEFAPNGTLRQRFPKGTRLPVATILPFVRQVAEALVYAHQRRLVHRDVKPENMLLGSNMDVLLSDFGIALITQTTREPSRHDVVGTAAYMSPEQLQGRPQAASDQYALGIVVYEWLAGDLPFRGTFTEVASQHVLAPPPPLRQKIPDITYELEAVIQTALAKDPQQRFASVTAFANALEQASRSQPALNRFDENLPTLMVAPHSPTPQTAPAHFTPIPPPPPLSSLAPESNYHVMPLPSLQPGVYQPTQKSGKPKQGISRRALFAGLGGVAIGSAIIGVLLYEHFQSSGPQAVSTPTPGTSSTPRSATTTPTPANTPTTGSTSPSTVQGNTLAVYVGHSDQVTAVEWSPNNALLLASGSEDKTARVWSYTNLNNDVRHQQANMVYSLTWSPSGQYIASGGENPTIDIWDTTSGNTVLSYGGHNQPVYSVKWSPDGSRIVSGSADTSAQVWNASNATPIVSYTQHVKTVWAVAWSPDGSRIASASLDGTVQIWNSSTAANLATFRDTQSSNIRAVVWSPNGQYIAFGGDSKVVQVWNISTNNMVVSYTGHSGHVEDVKWSPDGTLIASTGQDQTVQIWNASTGSRLFTYNGHTSLIWAIDWSRSGQHIASASQDSTVRVWQAV